ASDYVTLKSEAVTVTRGRSRVRIDAEEVRGQLVLTVRGQIRRDQRPLTFRQRVPEPMAYFAAVLRRRLAAHGIKVADPAPRAGLVPAGATLVAEHESPPLAVTIRDLGKYSNNYVAEMLLKTLGAEVVARRLRPATWDDGLVAL